MYYAESLTLISKNILDKEFIRILDREIAHSFSPSSAGYTQLSILRHNTHISLTDIDRLMADFESSNIVEKYIQVVCVCNLTYDPNDGMCSCGRDVSVAVPNGEVCYRVKKQPNQPAYNPLLPHNNPKVFISYRRIDSSILASDIYYSLQAEGRSVFLDNGDIPAGANAEQVFLDAASKADYFISLVSANYYQSAFCKKEIAHSARCRKRMMRINIAPIPPAPNDMPWIDSPNWVSQQGNSNGLTPALEQTIFTLIVTPSSANIYDLRREGCQFLLTQLSPNDLMTIWNRLPHMSEIEPPNSKQDKIRYILQESNSQRLDLLCNALAP
jgi:hypothetical protein